MKKYYGIARVDKEKQLDIGGVKVQLELSWIYGQVGAMPIFDDLEIAYKYAKDNGFEVIEFKAEK